MSAPTLASRMMQEVYLYGGIPTTLADIHRDVFDNSPTTAAAEMYMYTFLQRHKPIDAQAMPLAQQPMDTHGNAHEPIGEGGYQQVHMDALRQHLELFNRPTTENET